MYPAVPGHADEPQLSPSMRVPALSDHILPLLPTLFLTHMPSCTFLACGLPTRDLLSSFLPWGPDPKLGLIAPSLSGLEWAGSGSYAYLKLHPHSASYVSWRSVPLYLTRIYVFLLRTCL